MLNALDDDDDDDDLNDRWFENTKNVRFKKTIINSLME